MKFKALFTMLLAGTLLAGAQSQGYKDGIEYYKAGQYDNARTILERTLNDPSTDKSLANYYLGCVALNNGDRQTAVDYFTKGRDINPENPFNYVGLGEADLKAGNVKSAEDFFKEAQRLGKKNGEVTVAIARAYYNADPVAFAEKVEKTLQKARKDTKNQEPAIYILEGDMKAALREYGDASASYEMAINFDDNNPEGYVKYANAYFFVNPNFAISKLEELLAKQPQSALAQRELAVKYFDGKHWRKAVELYGKYLQNPNHFPEDKAMYSVLLYWDNKYQPSLDVANEILARDPKHFLSQRMRVLNETALENYPAAVRDAELFFKNNPDGNFTTNDYVTYAQALSGVGQDSLAVIQYEKAVKLIDERLSDEKIASDKEAYAKATAEKADLLKGLSDQYTHAKNYLGAAEAYDAYLQLQENPSLNDLFGMTGRYLNVAATTDNEEERVKAADRGLEYINRVIERAPKQAPLLQRKARLYIARNNKQPDADAIATYKEMTDFLDEDPANMSPENKSALALYREAYSFNMLYYGNIEKDKDKMAEATAKFNAVDEILNPKAAESGEE